MNVSGFVAACGREPTGDHSTWLFDLRYNARRRTHSLFLYHVTAEKCHNQTLPVGQVPSIVYFPDTPVEAAGEIATAIVHVFTANPSLPKPTMLVNSDHRLTDAVNHALVTIGIPQEVLFVRCSHASHIYLERAYFSWYSTYRTDGNVGTVPSAVKFDELEDAIPVVCFSRTKDLSDMLMMREIAAYTEVMENSRPRSNRGKPLAVLLQDSVRHLCARYEADAKAKADSGDAWEQMSYGARLRLGCRAKQDRPLARVYLMKAATNPSASKDIRAQAHSLLTDWCMDRIKVNPMTSSRYVHAGFSHAEEACELVGPKNAPSQILSWAGLSWANEILRGPLRSSLAWQYPLSMQALEGREKQMQKEDKAVERKRQENPYRYRCANCDAEASSGSTLKTCSGKCDKEVKPYYCNEECQREDWTIHKPFCKAGFASSVPDSKAYKTTTFGGSSKSAAIQVPVTRPGGSITTLSSSDLSAAELKAMNKESILEQIGDGSHYQIERGVLKM